MTAGIFFDLTLTKPNLVCLSATRRQNFDAPVMKRVQMTTTAPRLFLAYATVTLTQICHITVVDGSFCYFTLWSSYLFHVPVWHRGKIDSTLWSRKSLGGPSITPRLGSGAVSYLPLPASSSASFSHDYGVEELGLAVGCFSILVFTSKRGIQRASGKSP